MLLPELRVYEAGWNDRRWAKGLKRLSKQQRDFLNGALVELAQDLAACKHPHLDARMQRWSPTRWHAPGRQKKQGNWYELRLGDRKNAARVIVCHEAEADVVYLVARTAIHDLDRLRKVVERF